MELEQLRHFLSVAELGNFTKAAVDVGLSQSALSRSIQRLEEELGQPLFDRQSRKAVLTDAGQTLEMRAKQIVSSVDELRAEICDDGQTGNVRVGAIPTIAPYFLPKRLQTFQKSFPKAKVIVQEDTTAELTRKLYDGAIDLAVAALPIEGRYLGVEELFEEELKLLVSTQHPLEKKNAIKPADLEGQSFILMGEAHCLTTNVVSYCHQKTVFPLSVERTTQIAMIQELVSLNHGISLIPAMASDVDHATNRVYRSFSSSKPTRTIVLVTNPYRFQSKLIQSFIKTIRDSI